MEWEYMNVYIIDIEMDEDGSSLYKEYTQWVSIYIDEYISSLFSVHFFFCWKGHLRCAIKIIS